MGRKKELVIDCIMLILWLFGVIYTGDVFFSVNYFNLIAFIALLMVLVATPFVFNIVIHDLFYWQQEDELYAA